MATPTRQSPRGRTRDPERLPPQRPRPCQAAGNGRTPSGRGKCGLQPGGRAQRARGVAPGLEGDDARLPIPPLRRAPRPAARAPSALTAFMAEAMSS